jgi:RNA polymerase sigma factor (sigma-70 family)
MTLTMSIQAPRTDGALLREYAERGSQDAFRQLVDTHVDMVYSAALRQVRDKHLAEEVSQAVFILLARKARELAAQPGVVLGGWLHEATRLTAKNALRVQSRRRRHERNAAMAIQEKQRSREHAHPTWADVYPLLDEGLGKLNERERAAIVLRFFERRTMAETGRALGVSEDAAQMRVSRALDKLGTFIASRRAVLPTGTAIAGVLRANAVNAAPVRLAEASATAGIQAGEAAQNLALELADGVQWAERVARLRTVLLTFVVVAAAGIGAYLWLEDFFTKPRPVVPVEMPREAEARR